MLEIESTPSIVHATVASLRLSGKRIGLVPTMGALHEGHISLFERAAAECDVVVGSVFVNPLQFTEASDFDNYPRNLEKDGELAREHGVTLLFCPTADEMFPNGNPKITVDPGQLGELLEGASRPGHFRGVATIVAKLFLVITPDRAYFGEKDFQQLAVIRQMVNDLSLPVAITSCAIVRDSDGCALSSRNARLSVEQREKAVVLYRALLEGRSAYDDGERDAARIESLMAKVVDSEPMAKLDYVVARNGVDLSVIDQCSDTTRLLVAANIGDIRLIDNMSVIR